jgi:aminobenzoyl-glutamate utilization protein B
MKTKQDVIQWLETNRAAFIHISDEIWANPEIALKEFKAARLQSDFMETEGFRITRNAGGLNTAFIAEWGKGKPVIGFLGEYDALLNLSQKNQAKHEPVVEGGLGHGCGHNLLGAGCMAAAVAVKRWLEATGQRGTVRYYGCPAEEAGDGKVYMTRAGVFKDLDAGFNYHPMYANSPNKGSSVGVRDIKYRFHGITAHAGGAPHLGRSALDAVELMNVGVNYLREHVTKNVRMHYVITHGGDLPNIVPSEAEVWYFLRAQENEELEDITRRVHNIAEGAAMMTETRLEEIFQGGCSKLVCNHYLADLLYENLKMVGPTPFTDVEKAYAQEIIDQYPKEVVDAMPEAWLPNSQKYRAVELKGLPLIAENFPSLDQDYVMTGSTDVGDVSQVAPLGILTTACFPAAATGHSWGIVAVGGMSIGHKGMLHAAKAMALAAMDCYTDPVHLQRARQEFDVSMGPHPYTCPIPMNVKPKQYKENE